MTATPLDVQRDGPIARVFLNRPGVRNAFDDETIAALAATFGTLGADLALRAIVLGGHGPVFCAGADLEWMRRMAGYSWEENRADAQALADMLWILYRCPVPVIGRIHGDCYAGGMGLAAVCDVLVAADTASFCLSEARLGLLPATVSPYVVRALGEQACKRYFLTAERLSAARAHELGFVHEVCASADIDARIDDLVGQLLQNGPLATRACKALVQDVAGQPITEALRADTARRIADMRSGDEGREGVAAFLARRAPAWRPER